MAEPLGSKHHVLIQALLTRGPMAENDFHALFSALTGRNPVAHKNLFDDFLLKINKELAYVQFELRGCRNQYDGRVFYGVVNNVSDDQSKIGTKYSAPQLAFYKAVAEMIIHDVTNQGFITNIEALNIRLENQVSSGQDSEDDASHIPYAFKHFTMSQKEKTLNDLIKDQWLYTSNGKVGLGVRSFLDLQCWFQSNEVPACNICNEAGIRAFKCPDDDCNVRIHEYCLEQKFPQWKKVTRVCPQCRTAWPSPRKRARRCNDKFVDAWSSKFSAMRPPNSHLRQTRNESRNVKVGYESLFQTQTEAPWGPVPKKMRTGAVGDRPPLSMPSRIRKRQFRRYLASSQMRIFKANWINRRETIFIDILVDRVRKGKIMASSFSKRTWKGIENEFSLQSNMPYNLAQLKNKYCKLRRRYNHFEGLIKQPGFRWDPTTSIVTADDATWDDYIKVNRNAKAFRKSGCPEYRKLRIIFGDTTASEKLSRSTNQDPETDTPALHEEDGNSSDNVYPTSTPTNIPGTRYGRTYSRRRSLNVCARYGRTYSRRKSLKFSNSN